MALLDQLRLDDRVVILINAAKGIGKVIALALAEAGAKVLCAALTQSDVDAAAEACHALGAETPAISVDVIDEDSHSSLAQATLDQFGRIDVLVNKAGGASSFSNANLNQKKA